MTATSTQPMNLGTIPNDWSVETLAGLGGKVTSGSRGWAKYYSEYGDLFVRITNLTRSRIYLNLSKNRYVQVPGGNSEAERTRLAEGDLLVSITADIGIIGYVDQTVPKPAYINQHIARVRLPSSKVSSRFIAYYLSSWAPQGLFLGSTDTGAKAGMNLTTVGALRTVVPPLPEQLQIAESLADMDDLIGALERLISKKQAINQGMMHQLLTCRTRMAGFTEPWREVTLGDLGKTYGGLSGKSASDFGAGNAKFITFMNVMSSVRVDSTWAAAVRVGASERQNAVAPGDVLFNGSSETPEELALAAAVTSVEPRTYLNSFCFGFRPRSRGTIDSQFLAYLFRGSPGRSVIQALAQGSTRYNLSKSRFRGLSLWMPGVDEQTAIARALSEADDEVAVLGDRLVKARAIREGMMQELLTGRTRLPVKEVAA